MIYESDGKKIYYEDEFGNRKLIKYFNMYENDINIYKRNNDIKIFNTYNMNIIELNEHLKKILTSYDYEMIIENLKDYIKHFNLKDSDILYVERRKRI